MPVSSADPGPVLVTGASGFIGSSVVRALLDRGARVRALIEPGRDEDNLAGLAVERVVGEGDAAPTPTGRTIVEFLNGRIPAFVDTALNVVHVDDVARGHVLAAESGHLGRSYILGGENMSLQGMLSTLADICGLAAPRVRLHPRVV